MICKSQSKKTCKIFIRNTSSKFHVTSIHFIQFMELWITINKYTKEYKCQQPQASMRLFIEAYATIRKAPFE